MRLAAVLFPDVALCWLIWVFYDSVLEY